MPAAAHLASPSAVEVVSEASTAPDVRVRPEALESSTSESAIDTHSSSVYNAMYCDN
jgi:hypothetical protein